MNGHLLLTLALVVGAAQLAGWAIAKVGQPRVMGEILAGIMLGPSLLGALWPQGFAYLFSPAVVAQLNTLAQLGLVLFMFLVGTEFDLDHLRGKGRKIVAISSVSVVAPVLLGFGLGLVLYDSLGGEVDRFTFALFLGTAMAITAFPVLARILQERQLTSTRVGVLAITCAALDDLAGWCILALVVAMAQSGDGTHAARAVALTALFVTVMLVLVRPLIDRAFRTGVPAWVGVVVALLAACCTERIGVHSIFGAFLAGAIMPHRPPVQRELHAAFAGAVDTFLLPVFFMVVGLSTEIGLVDTWSLVGVTLLVTAVAIAGKLGESMVVARLVGETWRDGAALGVLMNTRGLTELVILSIGRDLGIISPTVFTVMVIMALVTTLMAAPLLNRIYRPGHQPTPAEPGPAPERLDLAALVPHRMV